MTKAPSRSSHRGVLALSGLINVEVNFYTAVGGEKDDIARHRFVKVGGEYHAVGNQNYDKHTGEKVEAEAVITGVLDTQGDQVVVVPVSDEEVQAILAEHGSLELLGYLPEEPNRWLLPNGRYYQLRVAPLKKGKSNVPNPVGEKVFALLLAGLEHARKVALLSFVMREGSARQYGLLDQHGRLTGVHYSSDVREERPLPEVSVSVAEKRAVTRIIQQNSLLTCPELLDSKVEALRQVLEQKRADPNVEIVPAADEVPAALDPDLLSLLEASLDSR